MNTPTIKPINLSRRLSTRSFWVNELLIFPKILYFFIFMAVRCTVIFRLQFFRYVFHLHMSQYGTMMSIASFVQFLTAPFWTFVSDKYRKPKLSLIILSLIGALLFMLFAVAPLKSPYTYAICLLICCSMTATTSSLIPLMDKVCLGILADSATHSKELYGRQRLFGCVGDIVATVIMGHLVDRFHDPKNQDYNMLYVGVAVSEILFILSAIFLIPSDSTIPKQSDPENPTPKQSKSPILSIRKPQISTLTKVGRLLTNYAYVFLLLVAFLNGFCKSVGAHFISNFFEDKYDGLGASKRIASYITIIGYVFEILSFYLSTNLLRVFKSFHLLIAAQVTVLIRFSIHGFLPTGTEDPKYVYVGIIAEIFKGLNFGLMQAAGVMVASKAAPPELQATAQGFYSSVYQGLAPSLAGLISTVIYGSEKTHFSSEEVAKAYYASRTGFFQDNSGFFRLAATFSLAAIALLLVKEAIDKFYCLKSQSNNNEKSNVKEIVHEKHLEFDEMIKSESEIQKPGKAQMS